MSNTIDFGIDLGTTNSAIARFSEGKVEIFKNPLGLKTTLPSVVAFRKNRILVGDKAREYLERDPHNVFGLFKRKMGTDTRFKIGSTGEEISPVNLSAHVLRELKNFIYTGETPSAVVVTIPASFDTLQSNATKVAGHEAGFSHVTLLQEPIAASLAYVNQSEKEMPEEGQWLVYDLGGGTFDVALVRVQEGEMRVIDHEGDNFLGGSDFDAEIIEKLVIPHLYEEGEFTDLEKEFKSASGKYNRLYYFLLHKAEEAKVQLSSYETADIEFEIEDESGELLDIFFTLTRKDFEGLISDRVEDSIGMIQAILARNDVAADEIRFVLMVGGSTYIPYVRSRVGEALGIPVNCNIDPTTAVAVGAAFYAGTRNIPLDRQPGKVDLTKKTKVDLTIRFAYQKATQEPDEYFSAKIEGNTNGLSYRITRQDGGFDTGLKQLAPRIEEDLPLVENTFNSFKFSVFDQQGNALEVEVPPIGITHGKYSVVGQPLPNDICIEVDDIENNQTKLEAIFKKNEILPLKRTFTKVITRTVKKDGNDKVVINVLEGSEAAIPSTLQPIGIIAILGNQLSRDLVKGSDVEITLEISESRDLTITSYLLMTDQEFQDVFSATQRTVNISKLSDELQNLIDKGNEVVSKLEAAQEYETAGDASRMVMELEKLLRQTREVTADDVTDLRYQMEDKKRKLAQELAGLTREQEISDVKINYFEEKRECQRVVLSEGTEAEKAEFERIVASEKDLLRLGSIPRINETVERLRDLKFQVLWRTPEYLKWLFYYGESKKHEYSDPDAGERYLDLGREGIASGEWGKVQAAINGIWSLLPERVKSQATIRGTGIG